MNVVSRRATVRKMHGAHNAFVVLDERPRRLPESAYAALARRLCAPEAFATDGLLVIAAAPPDSVAAATMLVVNADGSAAEMCGNGVRCVGRYLAEEGAGERFTVATAAGPIGIEIVAHEPVFSVRVDMGLPELIDGGRALEMDAAGHTWRLVRVSLGNPHAVAFVDDLASVDLERLGRELNAHPALPGGTNVHVARILDESTLEVRHYERGVGLTQACGTGAVACAVAARLVGSVVSPVDVRVPGGVLRVELSDGGAAYLTGPAETLEEREIDL